MSQHISRFLRFFPGFKTFAYSGERFKIQEDNYKRKASSLLHDLLDDWVNADPASLLPAEIVKLMGMVLREPLPGLPYPQNLTGWRDNQFVLDELLASEKNRNAFANYLHPLLKKAATAEEIDTELTSLLEWLNQSGASPAITKNFPSLILFFWNPRRFIFIKPRIFDRLLQEIGEQPLGQGKRLTASEYNRVLKVMLNFGNRISTLQPRDMIDLQSFYYVVMSYGDKELPDYTVEDTPAELKDLEEAKDSYAGLDKTEKETVISSRIGQGLFRANVIQCWQGCAVTDCKNFDVLIASHIKPWKDCSNKERLDTNNGLLLIPNLDKLFDKGLITFQGNGKIQISSKLTTDDLKSLNVTPHLQIRRIPSQSQKGYLDFHRENIFDP